MTLMTLSQNELPVPNGFRVDISRGERVGRVSSEWFSRPDDERYLSLADLHDAVRRRADRAQARTVESRAVRVEAIRDNAERLALIVPLSILLIGFMLYINFGTLTDTLLAASVIPMTLVGGIFALVITGTAFSVSAAIGFVALFGIAAMDGIIVLSYFNRMVDEGRDKMTALHRTCEIQMRPVMMTCVVACVGLFPAAISTGIGSQVQKPLALVVVGGMLLAPIFILLVLPVLIEIFSRRDRTPPDDNASPMAAE